MRARIATRAELAGFTSAQLRKLISDGVLMPISGGAFELFRWTFPAIAASAVNPGQPVQFTVATAGTLPADRQVIPVGSSNLEPFGVALATAAPLSATPPFSAAVGVVDRGNTIKVTAGASLGVGADVGVATTGLAGNIYGPIAAASGTDTWRVGKAVSPAAAGEVFGLYVDPRMLSAVVR